MLFFPPRSPVLSRWHRAFYSVKWRCNFYNLILPDKIPENRDPVKKILIASYGTITLPIHNHSPITKWRKFGQIWYLLYINRVMTEWQRLEKKGDDPRDDIIDYGSMRTALDCFKGKFRLNGDALPLPRPPPIECHPLGWQRRWWLLSLSWSKH